MVLPDGKLEILTTVRLRRRLFRPRGVYVAADVRDQRRDELLQNFNADVPTTCAPQVSSALDDKGQAVEGMARVGVNIFKRGQEGGARHSQAAADGLEPNACAA
jgi:hypothetical protein